MSKTYQIEYGALRTYQKESVLILHWRNKQIPKIRTKKLKLKLSNSMSMTPRAELSMTMRRTRRRRMTPRRGMSTNGQIKKTKYG